MALNVLVVDDSSVMRAMIIKTLRLSHLPLGEIYQASNGLEGLKVLQEHWIDLALVDINMPVMNGEEMIDRVRQNPETADLSIIVISTEGSETRIEMLENKGAGFIHKPFTPETLRNAIIKITGVSHEQQIEDGTFQGSGPDF
ncbi:MAG: response regulator [candidate division KSB1 bacterium]|nr:response regulator [candidate division KSB1 bacterium]